MKSHVVTTSTAFEDLFAFPFHKAMRSTLKSVRHKRRMRVAYLDVLSLNDHMLRDIGLNRGDVADAVFGTSQKAA